MQEIHKNWKERNEKANKVTENDLCFNTNQEKYVKEFWYIDSGATSHMTNNRKFFNVSFTEAYDKVMVANGKEVKVKGIGSGKIKCIIDKNNVRTITLKNVLYVPELYSNLMSVKKITELGFRIEFKKKECNIVKGNDIVVAADCTGNVYKLRTEQVALASVNEHNNDCIHTWHRKLGHRDPGAIRRLVKEKMADGIKFKIAESRGYVKIVSKEKWQENHSRRNPVDRSKKF